MKLDRFRTTLRVTDNVVYSFKEKVAIIKDDKLFLLDCRDSIATQKHITYVAETFNLKIVSDYWEHN
jgi:hypothetical protein|tara:strand:- start:398 stop:598 length:201 start_codon:yes stop_codon:yes gene_type:complete